MILVTLAMSRAFLHYLNLPKLDVSSSKARSSPKAATPLRRHFYAVAARVANIIQDQYNPCIKICKISVNCMFKYPGDVKVKAVQKFDCPSNKIELKLYGTNITFNHFY